MIDWHLVTLGWSIEFWLLLAGLVAAGLRRPC